MSELYRIDESLSIISAPGAEPDKAFPLRRGGGKEISNQFNEKIIRFTSYAARRLA